LGFRIWDLGSGDVEDRGYGIVEDRGYGIVEDRGYGIWDLGYKSPVILPDPKS
jgi:hypothetical protein